MTSPVALLIMIRTLNVLQCLIQAVLVAATVIFFFFVSILFEVIKNIFQGTIFMIIEPQYKAINEKLYNEALKIECDRANKTLCNFAQFRRLRNSDIVSALKEIFVDTPKTYTIDNAFALYRLESMSRFNT